MQEINADKERPVASTQKLLTALIVAEEGGMDELVTIASSDTWAEPSKLYIKAGEVYRRGDLLKALYWDTQGLCLFAKRLEKGRFVWPSPADGVVRLTPAQLSMLLEGIDWRMPLRTWRPEVAG